MRFALLPMLCAGCGFHIAAPGSDEATLAPEPPANAIVNGGFEHGGGWTWLPRGGASVTDTATAHAGRHAMMFSTGSGNGNPDPRGGTVVSDPFGVPIAMTSTLTWFCRTVAEDDVYGAALDTAEVTVNDLTAGAQPVGQASTLCAKDAWSFGTLTLPPAVNGHTLAVSAGGPALILDDVALDQSSVRLTAPADGATVSGTIAISATASEILRAAPVALALDGVPLGSGTASLTVYVDTRPLRNGPHTLTAETRDVGGAVAQAVARLEVANLAPDGGLIVDGSFESGGLSAWDYTGNVTVAAGGPSGHWAARFATPRSDHDYDRLWQTVTLPATGDPTLTFSYQSRCGGSPDDDARADIVSASGTVLASLSTCSAFDSWTRAQIDLGPWRGQTLSVRFSARLGSTASLLLVDDVNVR